MAVTGEGTQPLSDLAWKKKENKYLGANSLNEKEMKEKRDLDNKPSIDSYLYRFPKNENYLGFENVSNFFFHVYHFYRIRTFATPIQPCKFCTTAGRLGNRFSNGSHPILKSFTS